MQGEQRLFRNLRREGFRDLLEFLCYFSVAWFPLALRTFLFLSSHGASKMPKRRPLCLHSGSLSCGTNEDSFCASRVKRDYFFC